jgi:tungstate transport system substrate-binding protein
MASHVTCTQAENRTFIVLASTTSTENSGLLAHLSDEFSASHPIDIRVVAVGTGQALQIAKDGNADLLMVHHPPSEKEFVTKGYGVDRIELMYNDFIIVGPQSDPAGIKGLNDPRQAFIAIKNKRALFISRGDNSGTHKKEIDIWANAELSPSNFDKDWYREIGSGMGAALNMASSSAAYTLTDRGTWLSFSNRSELEILFQGSPPIHNQYSIILVNPKRHPHVKQVEGQVFINWLVSNEGQAAINNFSVNDQQLFFANAKD